MSDVSAGQKPDQRDSAFEIPDEITYDLKKPFGRRPVTKWSPAFRSGRRRWPR